MKRIIPNNINEISYIVACTELCPEDCSGEGLQVDGGFLHMCRNGCDQQFGDRQFLLLLVLEG